MLSQPSIVPRRQRIKDLILAIVLIAAGVVFFRIAGTLASNLLGSGGGGEDPPPAGDAVTYTVSGVFLNAVQGNSYKSFDLPAKNGQAYKTAVVEFDMLIRGFPEGLFTGVHSFRRKGTRTLFYGLQIVNRNSKTTLDLGIDDILARGDGPWQAFHTYHLKITYDVPGRVVRLEVFEGGVRKQNLAGQAQHLDLKAGDEIHFSIPAHRQQAPWQQWELYRVAQNGDAHFL